MAGDRQLGQREDVVKRPARDLTRPDHLPKRRPDGEPQNPNWLPRQRRGVTPQMIGRYPDYDVFDAEPTWDPQTRRVVNQRLFLGGPLRFFSPEEEPTLRAFCDTATAQDVEPRVPVAEMVDRKFAAGELDGFRYEDMPPDPETWRITLAGLDASAHERHGLAFSQLGGTRREEILHAMSHGELAGGPWERVNVERAWSVCMRAILASFYSHPWAWNEIGFGGPAYPRGFMRLGQSQPLGHDNADAREPFEAPAATSEDPVRVAGDVES